MKIKLIESISRVREAVSSDYYDDCSNRSSLHSSSMSGFGSDSSVAEHSIKSSPSDLPDIETLRIYEGAF